MDGHSIVFPVKHIFNVLNGEEIPCWAQIGWIPGLVVTVDNDETVDIVVTGQ